jgi:hypothetical protein
MRIVTLTRERRGPSAFSASGAELTADLSLERSARRLEQRRNNRSQRQRGNASRRDEAGCGGASSLAPP